MKALPVLARIYIIGAILVAGSLGLAQYPDLAGSQDWLLLAVAILACLAQVRKVGGPTKNSNYDLSLLVYGFALLQLGRQETVWIMAAAGLFAWIWHRDFWYINLFNLSMWVISISVAGWAYQNISAWQGPAGLPAILAMIAAALLYTLINHLMLGYVIWLASAETLADSGAFDRLIVTIDTTLFGMGLLAGLVWRVNPFATLLIVPPVYVIYTALRLPALERKAETDAKTGLFNARHFTQALQKEITRADRFERPLAVVMADLDYLRNVNNSYGHLAGDAVLIGVANIIRRAVREFDVVARFGGEEFSFMMLETTPMQALTHIEAIRRAIETAEFFVSTSPNPIKVTMSFGISGRVRSGQTVEELIHQADLAAYQAKQAGRNRVFIYKEGCSFAVEGGAPSAAFRLKDGSRKLPAIENTGSLDAGAQTYKHG